MENQKSWHLTPESKRVYLARSLDGHKRKRDVIRSEEWRWVFIVVSSPCLAKRWGRCWRVYARCWSRINRWNVRNFNWNYICQVLGLSLVLLPSPVFCTQPLAAHVVPLHYADTNADAVTPFLLCVVVLFDVAADPSCRPAGACNC